MGKLPAVAARGVEVGGFAVGSQLQILCSSQGVRQIRCHNARPVLSLIHGLTAWFVLVSESGSPYDCEETAKFGHGT